MTQQENIKGTCSEISLLVLFIELTDQHAMAEIWNFSFVSNCTIVSHQLEMCRSNFHFCLKIVSQQM